MVRAGKTNKRKKRYQKSSSNIDKRKRSRCINSKNQSLSEDYHRTLIFQDCACSFLEPRALSTCERIHKNKENHHDEINDYLQERAEGGNVFFDVDTTRVLGIRQKKSIDEDDSTGESNQMKDPALVFFELANSPLVGYRVNSEMIVIRQNNNCEIHTGGIVWETSYLLAEFLSCKFGNSQNYPLGRTLEIGAGCGMLGLILAAKQLSSRVVVTEASEVMQNLKDNVRENVIGSLVHKKMNGIHGTMYSPTCQKNCISVKQLRWDHLKDDIEASVKDFGGTSLDSQQFHDLEPNSFDTIVGTDVVFLPSLVEPLLKTIQCMGYNTTISSYNRDKRGISTSPLKNTDVYLCLQVRCPDSHALLFSKASKYGLEVSDITSEFVAHNCSWGLTLECVLLKITFSTAKLKGNG